MEINKYRDIIGGITLADIPAGRMVVLGPSGTSDDGIYGVELPASGTVSQAKYCVDFVPMNMASPYIVPLPSYPFALRGGWDQTGNDPYDAEISQVYPGDRVTATIPSGTLVRLYGDGAVVTVTSDNYVGSSFAVGSFLEVSVGSGDEGKVTALAAGATVAMVEDFDATASLLTYRILS